MTFQERRGQQGDILTPGAQRRHFQPDDVETVKQILAEAPRRHFVRQHAVRRRDDAHIHLDGFIAAHALHLSLLEHTQQLGLKRQGHFPYLVQKQRAAVRLHKASFPPSVRAGECPLLMAEQLRFEQIFRQGRAVDGHKGLVAAGARGLNGARHKLLARAGLAGNEYRGLGRRDGFHHFHQFAHGLAPAQQKGRRFALRAARFLTFPRRTGMIQGALKRRLKFIQLQRLCW